MSPAAVWILAFFICADADDETCIDGEIHAASCAAAEAYLRAGLRDEQILHVIGCQETRR